jgi:methionyl-tRNA formyltransferase
MQFAIENDDDILSLLKKSRAAGQRALQFALPKIAAQTAPQVHQDESKAAYYPPISAEDGLIDWSVSGQRIGYQIRAFAPPLLGAFTFWHGQKVIIQRANPLPPPSGNHSPGVIFAVDGAGIQLATGKEALLITEGWLESPSGRQNLLSCGIKMGDRFG